MPEKKNYAKKILVLSIDTPACEAARALNEKYVGCALVCDGKGKIVGIVTDRDLACGVLGERLSTNTPIHEIMAPDVKYVFEGEKFSRVLQIMQRYGIRRVPVMRKTRSKSLRCVGIYTIDDFVLSGEVPLEELRPILRKQLRPPSRRYSKSERSTLRKEQTLNHFNKVIAKEMKIGREPADEIIFVLLKGIIYNIPEQVSKKFISEIPSLLQADFGKLPLVANKMYSLKAVHKSITNRYRFSEEQVPQLLRSFWTGLGKVLSAGNLQHVYFSLPTEFQEAFIAQLRRPGKTRSKMPARYRELAMMA